MYRSAQVRNLPIFRLFFELPCEVRCGGAVLKNGRRVVTDRRNRQESGRGTGMNSCLSKLNDDGDGKYDDMGFCLAPGTGALFGTIIGLDREYREKEAGFRTHFLVSLGSALMMIVSQYGFSEILTHDGVSLDPSRIAAQVVSGIGFIGAGTIIFNHQIVRGLTTAASLWATAGIGLTAGAGMSWLALAATILTLVALEGLSLVFRSLGSRRMVVVFSASDRTGVADTLDRIRTDGYMVVSYEVVPQVVGGDGITYRVTMVVKAKPGSDNNQLLALLRENTDIIVERIA